MQFELIMFTTFPKYLVYYQQLRTYTELLVPQ